MPSLTIKDLSPSGEVNLEAWVEGRLVARARVDVDALNDLYGHNGTTRENVLSEMRQLLSDYVWTRLRTIVIDSLQEEPAASLRFQAKFRSVESGEASAGVVIYDVTAGTTRPDSLSPFVRNKMRTEVHKRLVPKGGVAAKLIDLVS